MAADRRTTFIIAYPRPDPDQPFGDNPKAAKRVTAGLAHTRVAGAPVHVTGYDALRVQNGGGNGPGVLVEALLGGFGRWNWWLPRLPARVLRVEPSLPPRLAPEHEAA